MKRTPVYIADTSLERAVPIIIMSEQKDKYSNLVPRYSGGSRASFFFLGGGMEKQSNLYTNIPILNYLYNMSIYKL